MNSVLFVAPPSPSTSTNSNSTSPATSIFTPEGRFKDTLFCSTSAFLKPFWEIAIEVSRKSIILFFGLDYFIN